MGKVNTTLFIKKKGINTIVVQFYVDNIIFSANNVSLCEEFSKCMHNEFEVSIMEELNFFLDFKSKNLRKKYSSTNQNMSHIF